MPLNFLLLMDSVIGAAGPVLMASPGASLQRRVGALMIMRPIMESRQFSFCELSSRVCNPQGSGRPSPHHAQGKNRNLLAASSLTDW
jgi:hypothetical protein